MAASIVHTLQSIAARITKDTGKAQGSAAFNQHFIATAFHLLHGSKFSTLEAKRLLQDIVSVPGQDLPECPPGFFGAGDICIPDCPSGFHAEPDGQGDFHCVADQQLAKAGRFRTGEVEQKIEKVRFQPAPRPQTPPPPSPPKRV